MQKAVALFTSFLVFLYLTLTPDTYSSRLQELRRWTLNIRNAFSPIEIQSGPVIRDLSHNNYDLCSINGPILLDPTTSTFSSIAPPTRRPHQLNLLWKTKPYPRKRDKAAMFKVKELTLTSVPPKQTCGVTHTSPALVFSTGGYVGSFFHEFMDGLIPLFTTLNAFFRDDHQKDIILVVSDYHDSWTRKYADLLPHFTKYPIINMDNETIRHCFPSVIVGLVSHGYMIIDPTLLPHPKALLDFQYFLQNAYGQNHDNIIETKLSHQPSTRPRLVLLNRKVKLGRAILNLEEVKNTAKEIWFDLTGFEPNMHTSLVESFRLIHGSHAMLGVHGPALTHFMFLRAGSLLMQVVPIGTQWLSDVYVGDPSRVLGLEDMEYKIKSEESSLVEKCGSNHLVLRDPGAFYGGNMSIMRVMDK